MVQSVAHVAHVAQSVAQGIKNTIRIRIGIKNQKYLSWLKYWLKSVWLFKLWKLTVFFEVGHKVLFLSILSIFVDYYRFSIYPPPPSYNHSFLKSIDIDIEIDRFSSILSISADFCRFCRFSIYFSSLSYNHTFLKSIEIDRNRSIFIDFIDFCRFLSILLILYLPSFTFLQSHVSKIDWYRSKSIHFYQFYRFCRFYGFSIYLFPSPS